MQDLINSTSGHPLVGRKVTLCGFHGVGALATQGISFPITQTESPSEASRIWRSSANAPAGLNPTERLNLKARGFQVSQTVTNSNSFYFQCTKGHVLETQISILRQKPVIVKVC